MKRSWEINKKAYPKKVKHAKMKPYNRKENEFTRYDRSSR